MQETLSLARTRILHHIRACPFKPFYVGRFATIAYQSRIVAPAGLAPMAFRPDVMEISIRVRVDNNLADLFANRVAWHPGRC